MIRKWRAPVSLHSFPQFASQSSQQQPSQADRTTGDNPAQQKESVSPLPALFTQSVDREQTLLQTARARRAPGISGRASQAVAQASPQAARRDVRRETAQISRGFARDEKGRRVRQTRTPGDAFVARPARCSGGGGARRDWMAPMVDGGRRLGAEYCVDVS